jgi:hypothetical protein
VTLQAKVRALQVAIALVLLWPFAHYALVQRYDVNPWKFAGWAMYSRLGPQAHVSVRGIERGTEHEIDLASAPADVQNAAQQYQWRTRQYGVLVRPDALARATLKAFANLDAVVIRRESPFIDPGTDRLALRRWVFRQRRDGVLSLEEGPTVLRRSADDS